MNLKSVLSDVPVDNITVLLLGPFGTYLVSKAVLVDPDQQEAHQTGGGEEAQHVVGPHLARALA